LLRIKLLCTQQSEIRKLSKEISRLRWSADHTATETNPEP